MKKQLTVILLLSLSFLAFPKQALSEDPTAHYYLEEKGEVYFSFPMPEKQVFMKLLNTISVDKVDEREVFAYANAREFPLFEEFDIPYTVLPHPGDVDFDLNMKTWEELQAKDLTDSWDFYPTYEAYVALMYQFEQDFPEMVEIVNIGQSVMGRDLLFAKISPQVESQRPVPQFMYTSTMHGDETAGFILSLRLIHYLLTNYGVAEDITHLMDHTEIWICPNENPDGTYTNDNSTVSGATRGNANGVDLNRNYPNPVNDPTSAQQTETTAMINFTDTINFIMSANMHGGIELVNFPFDSWTSSVNKHADHDWWEFVMYEYVDTVHQYSPAGYMAGMGDGVTHGGDWYVIYGSRQDYFNYYRSCREFTLELSNQKLLNPSLLPAHWDYNYRSLLNYIRQSTFGVHGLVYDNETGEALEAEIYIPGYDKDNSEVVTSMAFGNYNRPLLTGTYDMQYSAEGYSSLTIEGVDVVNYQTTRLNVALGAGVSDQIVSVTIDKEGEGMLLPFEGTEFFNLGANVFLEAEPEEFWEFEKWVIEGEEFFESQLVYSLDGDAQITAYFQEIEMVPEISLHPDQIHFGAGVIDNVYSKNLRIKNKGYEALEIFALSLEGDDVFFLEDPVTSDLLIVEPGEEEIVPVFFQPLEEQEYTASISIESNDPDYPLLEVPVTGHGLTEAAVIVFSPDTMEFGEVLMGETSEKTLTVINQGNLPLTLEEVEYEQDSPFTVSGEFPITLEPEQEQQYTVTFAPASGDYVEQTVVFMSNADNDPEAELLLRGQGLDPTFAEVAPESAFSLKVFPNPLKQTSGILLEMESIEKVSLRLYNLQGTLMASIFEGELFPGEHRFDVSAVYRQLPPGMYILSAVVGKEPASKRILKLE